MVDKKSLINLYEFVVYVYRSIPFSFCSFRSSYRVEIARASCRKPFVFSQAFVVGGVDLCISGLGHWYQPKRITIAGPTVEKKQPYGLAFYEIENVNGCFDTLPP